MLLFKVVFGCLVDFFTLCFGKRFNISSFVVSFAFETCFNRSFGSNKFGFGINKELIFLFCVEGGYGDYLHADDP